MLQLHEVPLLNLLSLLQDFQTNLLGWGFDHLGSNYSYPVIALVSSTGERSREADLKGYSGRLGGKAMGSKWELGIFEHVWKLETPLKGPEKLSSATMILVFEPWLNLIEFITKQVLRTQNLPGFLSTIGIVDHRMDNMPQNWSKLWPSCNIELQHRCNFRHPISFRDLSIHAKSQWSPRSFLASQGASWESYLA